MKRFVCALLAALLLLPAAACARNLTDREPIVRLFRKQEAEFLAAAATGDWKRLERLSGVREVDVYDGCADICCGGSGFGSSTHYFGIFYSEADELCAVRLAGPEEELTASGSGYLYEQRGGDNRYYVEPLGHHFFYYAAHF